MPCSCAIEFAEESSNLQKSVACMTALTMVRDTLQTEHIADGTHMTNEAITLDDIANPHKIIYMKWCCVHHEASNCLFKLFHVAVSQFERAPEKHGLFVHAIAQIVQLRHHDKRDGGLVWM